MICLNADQSIIIEKDNYRIEDDDKFKELIKEKVEWIREKVEWIY